MLNKFEEAKMAMRCFVAEKTNEFQNNSYIKAQNLMSDDPRSRYSEARNIMFNAQELSKIARVLVAMENVYPQHRY